jgi:hypothetical protein
MPASERTRAAGYIAEGHDSWANYLDMHREGVPNRLLEFIFAKQDGIRSRYRMKKTSRQVIASRSIAHHSGNAEPRRV